MSVGFPNEEYLNVMYGLPGVWICSNPLLQGRTGHPEINVASTLVA